MIPDYLWPAFAVCVLLLMSWWDERRINRRRDMMRAIEAERIARENASPLGSVRLR